MNKPTTIQMMRNQKSYKRERKKTKANSEINSCPQAMCHGSMDSQRNQLLKKIYLFGEHTRVNNHCVARGTVENQRVCMLNQ